MPVSVHALNRAGYTLIELLVALALSAVLVAAVYVALDLQARYTTAGQAEAERLQLVRSVFSRIERDLRCVEYRAAVTEAASTGTSGSGTSSSTGGTSSAASGSSSGSGGSASGSSGSSGSSGTASTSTASTESEEGSSTGLYGTATTLQVHASLPSRVTSMSTLATSPEAISRTSDQQSVVYFLGVGGNSDQAGLCRLVGDRLALDLANEQGGLSQQGAELLAPEVSSLTFRYFDGSLWREDWDSTVLAGLPFAVEIVITVTVADADRRLSRDERRGSPSGAKVMTTKSYRLVVAITPAVLPEETTTTETSS